MTGALSLTEVDRYRKDGYLFPIDVLTAGEAAARRTELEALEAHYRDAKLPLPLAHFFRENGHVVIPLLASIARTPAVLDVVQSVLGPNLLVWSCELFIKEPGTPKRVSWHQDLTYWGLGETDDQLTAWIALSPATAQSGCMRFVAGSHLRRLVPHRETFGADNLLSRGQEIAVEVDERQATNVVLTPGQMSLHHGSMFHASGPNNAQDRRIGVAIRYIAPGVRQQLTERDYAMLVRGVDASRNWINIAPPDKPFTREGLDLYQRIQSDQADIMKGAVYQ